MSEAKLYEKKFVRMQKYNRNIPFTKAEIESMPIGFTPTSVREIPVAMFSVKRNHIPINNNGQYHKNRKLV